MCNSSRGGFYSKVLLLVIGMLLLCGVTFAQVNTTRGKVNFSPDPCPDNQDLYMEIIWNSAIKDLTVTPTRPAIFIGSPRIEMIDDGHAIVHLTCVPSLAPDDVLSVSYKFNYQMSNGAWTPGAGWLDGYTWTFSPSPQSSRSMTLPAAPRVTGVSYPFSLGPQPPVPFEQDVSGFNWYIDGVRQPVTGTAVNLSFATPGTHTVLCKPFNVCGRERQGNVGISRTVTVTCRPAIFAIKQPSPSVICAGEPISLTAESTLTPQSIVWKKDGVIITNATSNTLSVSQAGNYEVTATFSDGCVGQDTRVVTASEYPTQVITRINGLTQGFSGDPVVLEVVGGSDATDFHWKVNGDGNPFTDATGTGSFRRVIFRPGAASDMPCEIEVTPRRNTCPGVPFKRLFTVLSQAKKMLDTVKMYHLDLSGTPLGYLYLPNHTPERNNGCFGQLGPVTINATLDLGKYYNLGKHAFSADIKVKIVAHVDAPAQNQEWIFPLHIDQTAPEQMFSKRIDINPELIRFFTIEREGNSYVCNSTAAASAIRLMVTSTEEDVVDIQNVNVYPDAVTQDQANKRWEQTFTWTTTCPDVTDYLFLMVKQYGEVAPNNLKSPALWKNALRIRTESSDRSVTISMGEGSGKYYWRVMPLGSQEGGLANPTNLGDTSDVMPFTYTHPEEDKNWIYSRTIVEKNQILEDVAYANGLLRLGQQVMRTDGGENINIVAAQTIQDYVGRDAVTSLSIPVTDVTSLQYVKKLLSDGSGLRPYRAPDFDGLEKPSIAKERGGYYSGNPLVNGQNDRVPSAEGYPFAQAVYLNDGTGRIEEAAGPGLKHALSGGHTVRTFYTQASDAELVSLFGMEAPQDSSIEKITTYDANNVAKIKFQTKGGKVIATGVAITGTGGPLEELSTAPALDSLPSYYQAVKNNLRINNATVVSRTPLFLTMPGDVTVNYEITPAQLQEICGGNGNADLVAYYPFEENAQDVSGHNNHGIIGQAATIGKDILDRNSAYALTGSSTSFIQVPHTPDMRFDARDFTVSFWVKRSTDTNSTWANAPGVGKWNNLATTAPSPGTNEWALILHSEGGNTPAFMIEGGTTRHKVVASNAPLTAGKWYHLVGVRHGNLLKIYVNGRLENTLSTGSTAVSINNKELPLQIGRTGTFGTAAIFDDVQIYRRALSAEEINQLRDRSTLCTTCDYTVSFKLLKNGAVVPGAPLPAPFTINAGSCSTQVSRKYVMPPTILTLEGGVNYTLEKYLTLNNKTRDSATVTFIDSATAKVESFYRTKAKSRLDEINGYINRHEYDLLEQYFKTNATDDAANKQYILTLLPAGAGGCQQIIYIPKWAKCPVEIKTGNNCGPDGSSFEQYFEDYYKDRTDLLTVVNGETILNYAYFTNQYPGAAEREQHYKRGELNAMIRNLIAANPQLGTGQAACDSVWKVWKSEVMRYEAGITYTPEPQENTIGLEPAIPAKYSLLQSFLTSLDVHLQREATEEDADLCVGTGRPLFIERTTLYGKMGTAVIAPDLTHAYALVFYNSDVAGMKDMLRFYANIQDPDPEHPREPVLQDFNDLLVCDKYKMSQSTSMGDLGFAQQDSQDTEALAEQQISALREKCSEACENRESEFRQAIIGELKKIPGTEIQHYNVYLDNTYHNPGIWIGILDSTRNSASYTVSQCDLDGLTRAVIQNCKSKYCAVTLVPRDTLITTGTRSITYRTYGTKDQLRQIEKVLTYNFDLRLSDDPATCQNGWDVINKVSASAHPPRVDWSVNQGLLVDINYGAELKVTQNGDIVYLRSDSLGITTSTRKGFHIVRRSSNGAVLMDKFIREVSVNEFTNAYTTCSIAIDKNDGIILAVKLRNAIYDFDTGNGVTTLGSMDGSYLTIVRYNSAGKLLMAKATPFNFYSNSPEVDVDLNGNVYVTSEFTSGDLDFSGSQKIIQGVSNRPNTVVVKYDANLNYLWHVTMTSPTNFQYPQLAIDAVGAVAIKFSYQATLEMRNSNGLIMPVSVSSEDVTGIIKLTPNGDVDWVKTFKFAFISSISVGDNKSIYLVGRDNSSLNTLNIVKMSSSGTIFWQAAMDKGVSELYPVVYDEITNRIVFSGYIPVIGISVDVDMSEKEYMLLRDNGHTYFGAVYSTDGKFIKADVIRYSDGGANRWMAVNAVYKGKAYMGGLLDYSGNLYCVKYDLRSSPCPATRNMCFTFTGPRVKGINVPKNMEAYAYDPAFPDCEAELASRLHTAIDRQVEQLITARVTAYREQYYGTCGNPSRIDDKLTILKNDGQYHYTLYYYDRAGNLIRTVSPEGVAKPLPVGNATDIEASRKVLPEHKMVTEYQYNATGLVIREHSPDGNYLLLHNEQGTTGSAAPGFTKPVGTDDASLNASKYYNTLIYNDKGKIRFSRSAKQKVDGTYSYIKYDWLGRVIEGGEAALSDESVLLSHRNEIGLEAYPQTGTRFITRTVYTRPFEAPQGMIWPESYVQTDNNIRNRVSFTYTDADGSDSSTPGDRVYTIYEYDVHGKVRWIVQCLPGLDPIGIKYEYNLISGTVTQIQYSPENAKTSFYQKYEYDSESRLNKVLTSRDGQLWETDASYGYYRHGALKRMTLGEDLLQGVDYTYTIHGWLKGINHGLLDPTTTADPGRDASGNSVVGRDAFGMGLGYYKGDYQYANSAFNQGVAGNLEPGDGGELYDGNIASWTNNILYPTNSVSSFAKLTGYRYTYDKLNRLLTSTMHEYASGGFGPSGLYGNIYKYDGNGNIKTVVTGDITSAAVTYRYQNKVNNRLNTSSDKTAPYNYQYDAIGNLTRDVSQGTSIQWNAYGKVDQVERKEGTSSYATRFQYDALGNRVAKIQINSVGLAATNYYVRDAAGSVVAVYEKKEQIGQPTEVLLTELPIYGKNRLGMYTRATTLNAAGEQTQLEKNEVRISHDGSKDQYEERSYLVNPGVELTIAPGFNYTSSGADDVFQMRVGVAIASEDGGMPNDPNGAIYTRKLNSRRYELKDHLSNVRVTITDVKLSTLSGGVATDYRPEVTGTYNQYPFGLDMPGRNWERDLKYRYGFNGKEKDQSGEWGGTNYDYGFRIYNPAIGRFLSVDPLTKEFPWYTPYQFAGNKPIWAVDLDGLEERPVANVAEFVRRFPTEISVNENTTDADMQRQLPAALMKVYFIKRMSDGKYVFDSWRAAATVAKGAQMGDEASHFYGLYRKAANDVLATFDGYFNGQYYWSQLKQTREAKANAELEAKRQAHYAELRVDPFLVRQAAKILLPMGRALDVTSWTADDLNYYGDGLGKLGDGIEVLGFWMVATNVGAPVGGVFIAVGGVVSIVGTSMEVLSEYIKKDYERGTQKLILGVSSFGAGKYLENAYDAGKMTDNARAAYETVNAATGNAVEQKVIEGQ